MRTVCARSTDARRMRARGLLLLAFFQVLLITPGIQQAQAQVTAIQPLNPQPEEPWQPKPLAIQPAGQPQPMLKYRLLPSDAELTPGDAAPIYLRLRHELPEEPWKAITEKFTAWSELPLSELPLAEAVRFIENWSTTLNQIRFGSRRADCNWNYTLPEQHLDAIEILLPDAQAMRTWGRLLALKARVEIAQGKPEAAIATLETGLAFGRLVGEGPFLINRLVGVAICQMMLERVEELVQQPGCPNLYWALTVLPRPLIAMRTAIETERQMLELMIPELREPQEEPTAAEWSVAFRRLEDGLDRLARKIKGSNEPQPGGLKGFLEAWAKGSLKAKLLARARQELSEGRGWTAEQVSAMSDDEAVVRYIRSTSAELMDEVFAPAYLPDLEPATSVMNAQAQAKLANLKTGPLAILAEMAPAISSARNASLRLDRRIAALRAEEAVRMQAAAVGGKLPESWAGVSVVPVPLDPTTGAPFTFEVREGGVEITGGRIDHQARTEIGYRLTTRP